MIVPALFLLLQGSLLFQTVEVSSFSSTSRSHHYHYQNHQHIQQNGCQSLHRSERKLERPTLLLTSFLRTQKRHRQRHFATDNDGNDIIKNIPSDSDQLNLHDGDDTDLTNMNTKQPNHPHRRRTFFQNASLLLTVSTTIIPPLPSNAMYQDATTKIQLPSLNEIESSIPTTWSPDDNPFRNDVFDSKSSFGRLNTSPDSNFYASPRFVEHVDSNAVSIMTRYLSSSNTKDGGGGVLTKGDAVLDLCTSWTSHINPSTVKDLELRRVAGLGMNEEEMKGNAILTEYNVVDLNSKGSGGGKADLLPYEKESFDVVICQLSIDYLVRPLEVMDDVWRVLRPGGKVVILFSNRVFLEKAVGLWTGADDVDHAYTVGAYLRFCQGNFINIKAKDLSTRTKKGKEMVIVGDPMYVVTATRGNAV